LYGGHGALSWRGYERRNGLGTQMTTRCSPLWVLLVLTALILGLGVTPAHAEDQSPIPPQSYDVCGTKQDRYYIPADDYNSYYVNGVSLGQETWYSTNGAAGVTVVAKHWSGTQVPFALTFANGSNSTCVEALDTVTTQIVGCNSANDGTRVKFTYTNTNDSSNWWHTDSYVYVDRWDHGQNATIAFTEGRVADGAQVSVTGGDAAFGAGFYLLPGTYTMKLTTNETGDRVLPNRLYVPPCGTERPPAGDPLGGPIPPPNRPKATISACKARVVRVYLNAKAATRSTRYRIAIDPRVGKTKVRGYTVAAKYAKKVVLRKQKRGTLIKVTFNGKVVKRRLGSCS
jgi:hypothetical protein